MTSLYLPAVFRLRYDNSLPPEGSAATGSATWDHHQPQECALWSCALPGRTVSPRQSTPAHASLKRRWNHGSIINAGWLQSRLRSAFSSPVQADGCFQESAISELSRACVAGEHLTWPPLVHGHHSPSPIPGSPTRVEPSGRLRRHAKDSCARLASSRTLRCLPLKFVGSKEIDPLAGDEDFCRALVGDLFPSMRADFAASPSVMTHGEAVGVCKLSRISSFAASLGFG